MVDENSEHTAKKDAENNRVEEIGNTTGQYFAITPETKIYVAADRQTYFGSEAAELFKDSNDLKYLTKDGVIKVDRERWETAQQYERNTWMTDLINADDDRNFEHLERFNDYRALSGQKFENALELGCGPFTNLRLILQHVPLPKKITLLDPLIDQYQLHPHCTYKDDRLNGIPVSTVSSTIEDFVASEKYDLVVLINVLEHCFDIPRVFSVILSSLKPSGIFVFAEDMFSSEAASCVAANQFDCGHPIRLTKNFVESFLSEHFSSLFKNYLYGLYNQRHRIDLYFIGKRKK